MKKWISISIAAIVGFSAHISSDDARIVAENLALERNREDRTDITATLTLTWQNNETDIFYVFDLDSGGFVLIAAIDNVVPLLGYNFQHSFRMTDRAPQFDAMLENFSEQIEYAIENELVSNENIRMKWQTYLDPEFQPNRDFRDVEPLIAANWNQDDPWNEQCPLDVSGPGGNVYVGCVAVSMAQVMRYWQYPETGESSNSYYHGDYGTISADFEETTYDYSLMFYYSSTDATQLLMFHCGVGVEMEYGPDASGAWVGGGSPSALYALENYFSYHSDANFKEKDNYEDNDWESMLVEELDSGRPLIYRGYGDVGGHAWNIDGYEDTDYFHFNWGWSGWENGYYYLSDLNPGNVDFTSDQGGIFNLYPEILATPDISVSISEIDMSIAIGDEDSGTFSISNTGDNGSTLTFSISESPSVFWLSCSPISGDISAGSNQDIVYSVDASILGIGTYSTNLVILNNVGDEISIPVSILVTTPVSPIEYSFECNDEAVEGAEFVLSVSMENDIEIGGFQFDITVVPDEFLEFVEVNLTDRANGMVAGTSTIDNGIYRVLVYSIVGNTIAAGTGPVIEITFDPVTVGDVTICLQNITTSDPFGEPYESIFTDCCDVAIVLGGIKGDINNDGMTNILDVVQTVNFVLGFTTPNEYQFWAADFNSDGTINVLDVVQIVNVVLGIG